MFMLRYKHYLSVIIILNGLNSINAHLMLFIVLREFNTIYICDRCQGNQCVIYALFVLINTSNSRPISIHCVMKFYCM